jgi:hypothetical protein
MEWQVHDDEPRVRAGERSLRRRRRWLARAGTRLRSPASRRTRSNDSFGEAIDGRVDAENRANAPSTDLVAWNIGHERGNSTARAETLISEARRGADARKFVSALARRRQTTSHAGHFVTTQGSVTLLVENRRRGRKKVSARGRPSGAATDDEAARQGDSRIGRAGCDIRQTDQRRRRVAQESRKTALPCARRRLRTEKTSGTSAAAHRGVATRCLRRNGVFERRTNVQMRGSSV